MFPGWCKTDKDGAKNRKEKKWNKEIQNNEFTWRYYTNIMLQNNHVNADKQNEC